VGWVVAAGGARVLGWAPHQARVPHCSQEEVAKKYKRLAIKMHPDKNKEDDAVDKFQRIVTSYQTISDAEKRASYMDLYRLRCYMSQKPLENSQAPLLPHYVFVVDKSKHKHGKKSVREPAPAEP